MAGGKTHFESHTEDGYRLGYWVSAQRDKKISGALTPERCQLLDELGFVWRGSRILGYWTNQWEVGYSALKKYKEREGHCRIKATHTEDGYRLGHWVSTQRRTQDQLTEDRRRRLNELGFVWDALADQWEEGYIALKKFRESEGHCRVPRGTTEDGYRLGQWVSNQRAKEADLTEDRRRRLNELGFVWNPQADQWEKGYIALKKYREREGDCLVKTTHIEDGYRLGQWVNHQREKREELIPERLQRLDELGFVWRVLKS